MWELSFLSRVTPLQWERRVLTPGMLGKSQDYMFLIAF